MHSLIQQICDTNQCLVNLRFMDLSYSVDLVKMPDLSGFPKLEILRLRGCASLAEIFSSNQSDSKLSHMDFGHCKRLISIPSYLHLKNLNFLSLEGCFNITEFPKVSKNIRYLDLNTTAIKQVPSSIGPYTSLTELSLKKCTRIKLLPNSIGKLKCLKDLNLNGCLQLASLPDNIGELKGLKYLWLEECSKLMNLPDDICNLNSLEDLSINWCRRLKKLPENLGALKSLKNLYAIRSGIKKLPSSINGLSKLIDLDCSGCEGLVLPPFTGLRSLRLFSLEDCGIIEIPNSISSLVSLKEFNLSGNNLEMLPTSFKNLHKLKNLNLRNCTRLKCLSDLPAALEKLVLTNCILLEVLPSPFTQGNMDSLWWLDTGNCANLDQNECIEIVDDMLLRLESIMPQLKLYAFITFHNNMSDDIHDDTFQEMAQHNVNVRTFETWLRISGGEISPKLMYQNNSGSSLLLSLRAGPHDFMVLPFCAVYAFKDTSFEYSASRNTIFMKCECKFMTDSRQTLCFETVPRGGPFKKNSRDEVLGSEHTFLWYSAVYFTHSKYCISKASFKFYVDAREHISSSVVVSKCGVHILFDDNNFGPLIHKDDIGPLDSVWSDYATDSFEIKEDDEEEGQIRAMRMIKRKGKVAGTSHTKWHGFESKLGN